MSLDALAHDERQIVGAVLNAAFGCGLSVSVYDGEEWQVTGARSVSAVAPVVGITDETTLRFRDPARVDGRGNPALVGSLYLVHGNGADVMADWSDSPAMNDLLRPVLALAESLSA